jgi:hypothetical protein
MLLIKSQAVPASKTMTMPTIAATKDPFAIVILEGFPVADKNIIPDTIKAIVAKAAPIPVREAFTFRRRSLIVAGPDAKDTMGKSKTASKIENNIIFLFIFIFL